MIDFSIAKLTSLIIHKVGNKLRDEGVHYSQSLITPIDDQINKLLTSYFFGPFVSDEFYNFVHSSDINLNESYKFCESIFDETSEFLDASVDLAKHLYHVSNHPKIKEGELYVVLIKDCVVEDEVVDAIGLFKSENKDTFLKVYPSGDSFEINEDRGVNINRLDKGAIIFKSEKESGYKVSIVDTSNQGKEAIYWKHDFLGLQIRDDAHTRTKEMISLCKKFISKSFKENSIDKKSELDIMSKSRKYFDQNEEFKERDFLKSLNFDEELIESFESFKEDNPSLNGELPDQFEIAKKVVKNKKRVLTPTINLDNNFRLQIIGDSDNLERGYDDNSELHYYKLLFRNES